MDVQEFGEINLLLIEDDNDFRSALVYRLSKRNINVTAFASAEEGLIELKDKKYEVVVCDIKLPGMDGQEFLSCVKEYDKDLPVILITGYASLESAIEAVSLNAYDYLLKPLDNIDKLLSSVHKGVHGYRLEQKNRRLVETLQIKMNELELSQQKYEDLFDSASDIIYTIDTNCSFTSINKRMVEITKYKKEELIGKPDAMLISSINNDDLLRIKSKEILTGKLLDILEVKVATKSGEERIAELSMRPIKDDNDIIGIQCILRDITERKRSELEIKTLKEYYENIVSNVPDAILTISKSLKIESLNISFSNMFGKEKKEVLNKSIDEVFDQFINKIVVNFINANDLSGDPLRFEWMHKDSSGNPLWAEISLSNTIIANKECILMVISDITELKRTEEEKKEIEIQVLHMQKMEALGKLASGVAHEFNNILTVILGHTQLSLTETSIDVIKDSLGIIEGISKYGGDLVENLSAYAKPKEPYFQIRNITEVIDDVIRFQKRKLLLDNIKIKKEYTNPSKVVFDWGQMQQVFLNLFINANHAIEPTGRGTISISVKNVDKHVEIRFSDTGIGMDEETKIKIFDPFFTTKGAWSKDGLEISGTGLGLSVVHTIIEQHKGNITVESKKGRGATFIINLPIHEIAVIEEKDVRAKLSDIDNEQKKNLRILVIDDEAETGALLKSLFQKAGFKKIIRESLEEQAIVASKDFHPDVAFIDIANSNMNESQILSEIKSGNQELQIVIMSSKTDLNRYQLIRDGAYDLIRKPFNIDEILDLLRRLLTKDIKANQIEPKTNPHQTPL